MVQKNNTPEQYHKQDKIKICQAEISTGSDMLEVHTCDLPVGHEGEHKSMTYKVNENNETYRVVVTWVKIN